MTTVTFDHFTAIDFAQAVRAPQGRRFGQLRAALPEMPSDGGTVALGARILAGLAAAVLPFSAIAALFLYG